MTQSSSKILFIQQIINTDQEIQKEILLYMMHCSLWCVHVLCKASPSYPLHGFTETTVFACSQQVIHMSIYSIQQQYSTLCAPCFRVSWEKQRRLSNSARPWLLFWAVLSRPHCWHSLITTKTTTNTDSLTHRASQYEGGCQEKVTVRDKDMRY